MDDDLRRSQVALVRALVAGGATPEGFDPVRLRITADVLLNKRCGAVAARLPLVRAKLGPAEFAKQFFDWADGTPKRSSAQEATAFLAYLERAGHVRRRPRWRRMVSMRRGWT